MRDSQGELLSGLPLLPQPLRPAVGAEARPIDIVPAPKRCTTGDDRVDAETPGAENHCASFSIATSLLADD